MPMGFLSLVCPERNASAKPSFRGGPKSRPDPSQGKVLDIAKRMRDSVR
jgi:hypothetical protein